MRHFYQAVKENNIFIFPDDDFIYQTYKVMIANAAKRKVRLKLYLGLIQYIKEEESTWNQN